jgi:hypothetical protein
MGTADPEQGTRDGGAHEIIRRRIMGILNLLGKTIKFTGLGLGAKEFSDYVKKMKDEGKNPYSFTNFKKEYGDPLAEKVKNAYEKTVEKKAMGGMMEARKKGMGLRMKDGGATFPDLSGDGKITQKDILIGRGVDLKGGGKAYASMNKRYANGGKIYPRKGNI